MKVEIDIDNIVPNLDKTSLDEFITKDKDKNKYNDNTFKFTKNRHNIKFVNYLNANEIFKDLFEKLTSDNI